MLRGRAGGDGALFNLGEATVARAAVKLDTGERGFGHCLGRDVEQARRIAVLDALWQRAGDQPTRRGCRCFRPIAARLCRRARADGDADGGDAGQFLHPQARRGGGVNGFADPALDSQATFRAVLDAMSRPGIIAGAGAGLAPPAPLHPAAAAALLTLADYETTVWLAPAFAGEEVAAWLKFHTGARLAIEPSRAAFAIAEADALDLSIFAQGEPAYPDRSTTVIVQVAELFRQGRSHPLRPRRERRALLRLHAARSRLSRTMAGQRRNLSALGIDLILAAKSTLAALPRTARISGAA